MRTISNGRVSIGPEERALITAAFQLVADHLLVDEMMADLIVDEAAMDLEYAVDAGDIRDEVVWESFRDRAAQDLADVAADFGVRLELPGVTCEKW